MRKNIDTFQVIGTRGPALQIANTNRSASTRGVLRAVASGSVIAEARIRRIRQEIAEGTYLTEEKLDQTIAALSEALAHGPELGRRRAAI